MVTVQMYTCHKRKAHPGGCKTKEEEEAAWAILGGMYTSLTFIAKKIQAQNSFLPQISVDIFPNLENLIVKHLVNFFSAIIFTHATVVMTFPGSIRVLSREDLQG